MNRLVGAIVLASGTFGLMIANHRGSGAFLWIDLLVFLLCFFQVICGVRFLIKGDTDKRSGSTQ